MTAFRLSSSLAALQLMLGIKVPVRKPAQAQARANRYTQARREQIRERRISAREGTDFLVKQELLLVTNYLPDVERIKHNEVRVFMAVGEWGLERRAWYVQVAQILARQLDCGLMTFPGHHSSYMDMPQEWAATLRSVLHRAEAGE